VEEGRGKRRRQDKSSRIVYNVEYRVYNHEPYSMKRCIIIFFLLLSIKTTYGQKSDELLNVHVKKHISDLNTKGIDTVCIYQAYCVGCLYRWENEEDECEFEGIFISTYIFWIENGHSFMTKKDNCFDYSTQKIQNDSIWQFFFRNRDTIVKEEIKMPQFIEVKEGKEKIYSSSISHSRFQQIQIIVGRDTIINKELDDYHFSKEVGTLHQKNINYDYNINSQLKNFQLLISRSIKSATQKQKLIKTRR